MKKLLPRQFFIKTIISVLLSSPSILFSQVTAYTADGNTILLDHFDGSTTAGISAYSYTGATCVTMPAATPSYSFGPGPDGLNQALTLNPPDLEPAFSGTYLTYPGGQLLSQPDGTIEFWVYVTNYGTGLSLVEQGVYYDACSGWTFGMSIDATGVLTASAWAAFGMNSGSTLVPLNTWTHIAATWGSAGSKLYINGIEVGSDINTGYPAPGYGGSVLVRAGNNSGSSGIIDELRISNIARTPAEFNLMQSIPKITSFTPASGTVGSTVTISGTNFNTLTTNNIVRFGAVQAWVSSATATELQVIVPTGATYQPITVTDITKGLTAYSNAPFNVTFPGNNIIDASSMASPYVFSTGTNPRGVGIGDIDGDGKPDLVTANLFGNSVSVFRNTISNGTIDGSSLAPQVEFATGTFSQNVATGDLDGDGKLDLAVVNYSSNTVSLFRNTSTSGTIDAGSFAAKIDFSPGLNPYDIAIGDIDGDGKPDMAVTNQGDNTVSVFRNVSIPGILDASSFEAKVDFATGVTPHGIALSDMDGDGKTEMIISNEAVNTISVFRNTGTIGSINTGTFAAKVDFTTGGTPYNISIGDIDSDGKPDVVVPNYLDNTISIFRNISTPGTIDAGSFSTKVDFSTDANPFYAVITDLDGDGKPDISVANFGGNTVSLLRNTSTSGTIDAGSFAGKIDFVAGLYPEGIAVGDLDGDGKPDLSVTSFNNYEIALYRNTVSPPPVQPTISTYIPASGPVGTTVTITGTNFNTTTTNNIVWFGAVQATVTAASATELTVTVPTGATYQPITVTDVTTGLTASSNAPFTVTFTSTQVIDATAFAPVVDFAAGTGTFFVALGDIDGDGKPDLTVSNPGSSIFSVLRNTSSSGSITSGSFAGNIDFSTGSQPYTAALGDIDGDGKLDLAVADFGSNTVSVFRNTSTSGSIDAGSFTAKTDFITGTGPRDIKIGDIDGDGKPDLAVNNYYSNTVSILRNTSTSGSINSGSFADKVDFATGNGPHYLATGDIDGDGKPDLVITNYLDNTISVLRNISTSGSITAGSFEVKVDFSTVTQPHCITISDIDIDGKPDILVADQGSNTVSVFKNISTPGSFTIGSLATNVDFITGSSPVYIAVGDIDGDGKPDMVTANSNSNTVSVFRNTSTSGTIDAGSFAAKTDFNTGTGPSYLTIGDIDGDGKPDIAVSNTSGNTVSVLRNTILTAFPPTVSSFTPTSGPVGSSVTITGTNFNTLTTNNIVRFGAVQAWVSSATSTELQVLVPTGATYQPITATDITTGLTAYSSAPFTVTFPGSRIINSNAFDVNVDFPTGSGSSRVAAGDLDGDGKADLAVVNEYGNTISLYRNISTSGSIAAGSFDIKVDLATGTNPSGIAMGDIDGDGKPDLVVVNSTDNTVSVFRNIGVSGSITSGSFEARVDFATGPTPYGVAIGDIDGDGKPDIAVTSMGNNTISVFRNISAQGSITTGSFSNKIDLTAGTTPYDIALGDLNGDNKPDLAVTNINGNTISVFANTSTTGLISTGSFAASIDFATAANPRGIVIGDIDGDNKPDLTVANGGSTSVSVFQNTVTAGIIDAGSFTNRFDFNTGGTPYVAALADLDGDGKPEIAVTGYNSNTVSVFKNMSTPGTITSGSFADQVAYSTGVNPIGVATGDFDGDGKPDLAVANSNSSTVSVLHNMVLQLPPIISSFTPASGNIGTAVTITGTNFNSIVSKNIVLFGAVRATITAASPTELTVNVPVGATYQPISVSDSTTGLIGYSNSIFNVTFPSVQIIDATTFGSLVDFATGDFSNPYAVAIGDIDGDGKSDLAVVNKNSNVLSIYRNISTSGTISPSSFESKIDFATGSSPYDVAIEDIDGDGKPDIIVANYNSYTVSVFRNTCTIGSFSTSSFAEKVDFATNVNPIDIAVGDIDGDGKPDLAIANNGGNNISILRNTSIAGSITTGSFASKYEFGAGAWPSAIAMGDIDGDNKPDLVVANAGNANVSVFRNTSSAGTINSFSFDTKVDFSTGTTPYNIALVDIDGDTKLDITVVNNSSNNVSVIRNTSTPGSIGLGSFAVKVDFATGIYPLKVAVGDTDGDGKPDLAVTNYSENTVSLLKNTSTSGSIDAGSFITKVDYTAGANPVGIAIGDIDGDGKPDLVVANNAGNTVSVLRNSILGPAVRPVITSFAPTYGPVGTSVTITGTNFNTTTSNNIVRFGAVQVTVTAATATELTVTVPAGATYQPIIVTDVTTGLTANSSSPFTVTFPSTQVIDAAAFVPSVDFATGTNPYVVAIGDVDGDGKPDLAVVNNTSNTVSVFRNTSVSGSLIAGSFAPLVDFVTGLNPYIVSFGDLDGDGKQDLVTANRGSNTISIFRNTSTSGSITSGSFADKVDFITGTWPSGLAIGDIDGDGKLDIAVTNQGSNTISIFRNTSTSGSITSGSFSAGVEFTTGGQPLNILIDDMDGDGKPDLAVTNVASNSISIFRNNSISGTIEAGSIAASIDFVTGSGPWSAAVGDIDGDGKPDIAVSNLYSNTISVFRNTSTPGSINASSFADKIDLATGTNPEGLALGDIDGDGKPDLTVVNGNSNNVSILRNISSSGSITAGSFVDKVDFTTGTNPYSVAIGDLDGDNKPDLAVTNLNSSTISVLRNNILTAFPPAITSFTPTSGPIGTAVTITGTYFNTPASNNIVRFGAVQATVSAATATELTVTVPVGATYQPVTVTDVTTGLTASSGQSFDVTFASSNVIDAYVFAAGADFTTGAGSNSYSVKLSDIDCDGKSDLVVANYNSNTVSVYRNTSISGSVDAGSFSAQVDFTTGTNPYTVAVGDIDGDGKPDLVVANTSSNTVSVFRNTSTSGVIDAGSFAGKVDLSTGAQPYDVAIGDLDDDGKPELVVTNYADATISVLKNNCTPGSITAGSFANKIDFLTTTTPWGVAIADIDGDGKPDLNVVNYSGNTISLFRNTSSRGNITPDSFAGRVDFATNANPYSIASGDIDGDGKTDLAVTNFNANTVSIYRNTSTSGNIDGSSLAGQVEFATGSQPGSVSLGDFDGDGKPDMAVSNYTSSTITVYRNTTTTGSITTGSFSNRVDYTTGTSPYDVAIGDIDGDGKPDMAVTNTISSTVSVFRNRILNSNLVAWYPLDNNIIDASGNNNNGTDQSFLPAAIDRFGVDSKAVTFDGIDDYIVAGDPIPEMLKIQNEITLSAWIKISQMPTELAMIVGSQYDPTLSGASIMVDGRVNSDGQTCPAGHIHFQLGNGNWHSSNTNSVLPTNQWIMVTAVRKVNEDAKIYYNSQLQPSTSVSWDGTLTYNSSWFGIGNQKGLSRPFNGSMDDIRIYNKALTESEIDALYHQGGWPFIPTILSFAPTSGPVGTPITITGTNFNTTPANNIVWFGAVQAVVTSATATELTVTVPAGATYQPITVTDVTTGLIAYSAVPFNVTFTSTQLINNESFAPTADFAAVSFPEDVAIGDIDGDGKPDLAVVNYTGNTVSVYRNISSTGTINTGSFSGRVDFATGSNPRGIVIGDIDGDGKPDMAVTNFSENTISLYRNTSTTGSIDAGSFAGRIDFATGGNPYYITTGDIDSDGKPDLAVSNWSSNTVTIYRNTCTPGSISTGSFATGIDFATGSNPFGIVIGDIDSDSKPDLLVSNWGSNTISVFRNTSVLGSIAAGSFSGRVDFGSGANPYEISIADIDMDGKPDLIVANNSGNTVSVFRNTSTTGTVDAGTFAGMVDFAAGSGPFGVSIGDINGDGKPDMAVTNTTSNNVSVYRNTSIFGTIDAGSFAGKVDFSSGGYPQGIVIGDIDGDSKPDLTFANSSANTLSVLRNIIVTTWQPVIASFTPASGPVGTSVTISGTNFNTTAANNIVWFGAVQAIVTAATATELSVTVPTGTTYQPVTVTDITTGLTAYSDAPFNVTFNSSHIIDATTFTTAVDFTAGSYPEDITTGDIDGDGKPDLVQVNYNSNTVSVFRNTSTSGTITTGSFADKVDFITGNNPRGVAIGDLDGDGKPDLAVTNFSDNTVSVFRNTSTPGSITTGSFANKVDFTAGTNPYIITIGDVDMDGKPDLAVSNWNGGNVSLFRNTCIPGSITAGSFSDKVDFATGSNPFGIVITDIDGDKKPDLAVTNYASSTVSVLRNTSSYGSITAASLADKVDFSTGAGPYGISVGDIDIDGKPDLAIANFGEYTVSLFRNTGTTGTVDAGTFAGKVDFSTGFSPFGVDIGDFDGDGKPDIAVTNTSSNTVSVFRNTSTPGSITSGSLTGKVDFLTGNYPLGLAISDIDGDNKPDLIVTNSGAGTISVLQNTIMSIITPPVISSFTPSSGPIGSTITITGTNFNTTTTNNIVWFGAIQATVTTSTATELIVTVPTGATYQPITVTDITTGLTGYSSAPFTVTFPSTRVIDATSFAPTVDFATGTNPYHVAIGDIDDDGKPDLAISHFNGGSNFVSIFRNTSTPSSITTDTRFDLTAGTIPVCTDFGDIDGDGKPDLVVTDYENNLVSVFRNISTSGSITAGSFADKVDIATGLNPYFVKIGDIDGDGKPDLIVTNNGGYSFSVIRNMSTPGSITTGSFEAKVDFNIGEYPAEIALSDIDGDGKKDIVVTSGGNNHLVSVFRNISTPGTFTTTSLENRVDLPAGLNPSGIAIGDIDGDGKPDLIIGNYTSPAVSVFQNISVPGSITTGSFADRIDLATTSNPRSVAVGDINGDGKPDIAVASITSNTVSIFKNISTVGSITTGSFDTRIDLTTGNGPAGITIGDIDGDGKPDLVYTNTSDNTVSVLRNTIPSTIQPPVISSFAPTSGPIGTSVTISGTNFNTTTTNNIVWFGAVQAIVTSSTTTEIIVTVPTGATYQPITVTDVTTGLTAYSGAPFTVTFPSSQVIDATSFAPTVDFNTGIYPTGVAVGDIDGDSKPDLAIVNFNSNTVSIYRNTSSSGSVDIGSFATPVDFSIGSGPFSVALGDIDGDGKPDLAVANSGSNTVSVFRNTSSAGSITTGSFSDKTDFTTGTNPYYLSIGDINGDGKPDLAVTNYSDNTVSVFENTGTTGSINAGSFAGKVDFATGTNPEGVALGDIDGDGKPDLAITNSTSNTVSVLRNTSTIISISAGSFADKVDFTTGTAPRNLALGDVDGDGKPDIAVTNSGGNTVSVFRNISSSGSITTGSFENSVDFSTVTGPRGITFGDIDGDGKPDMAVANAGSNTISVFRNTSTPGSVTTGSFTSNIDFNAGTNPYQVVIGDIDGDGKPDLTVVNFNSNSVSVLRNTILPPPAVPPAISSFTPTSGNVGTSVTITGTNFNTSASNNIVRFGAVAATVTAATATELTVTVPGGATYELITITDITTGLTAYSGAPFTVTFPSTQVIDATSFAPTVDFSSGNTPYDVAISDLDGDGKPDLVVTNISDNTVSVYRNNSTSGSITAGSFDTRADFTTGLYPYYVAIGDLDGDGKPDLAVANYSSNTVSVFRNVSSSGSITTGSFAGNVDFTTGNNPNGIAIGDIDGDGKPDLIVTNIFDNTVSVLRNTGSSGSITTSSFDNKIDFATGVNPWDIAIGDIDSDGKPDIIVTNANISTVSVLRNVSTAGSITTGSLADKVDFNTGTTPHGIAVGDIDGDGKPDISVANQGSNSVSLLRNVSTTGSITTASFSDKVDFMTGAGPNIIAIGDINGDGKPDLAVTNGSNNVSVFRNTSTSGSIDAGSLLAQVDFTTGTNPQSVAIVDIDGDGKPEMITPNASSNTISVLRNTLVAPVLPPTIDSFTPSSGIIGSSVTINGTNFGDTQGTSVVVFGTTAASVTSWGPTQIIVTVPSLSDGGYTISVTTSAGTANSSTQFIVTSLPPPIIDSFTPSSGQIGSSVTIYGSNFGDTQGTGVVEFGTTTSSINSWSSTQIVAVVPALSDGDYTITVTTPDGTVTSSTLFTIFTPAPTITSFTPGTGSVGSTVTISGTDFGDIQGTSVVEFETTTASINSWSTTQIVAVVPALVDGDYTISVITPGGTAYSSTLYTVITPLCDKPVIRKKGSINILMCLTPSAKSYQWYLNDQPVTGATKQFYVARSNFGSYYVEVVYSDNCINRSDAISVSTYSAVRIYPNPSDSRISVDLNFDQTGEARIKILNSSGVLKRIIKVEKILDSQSLTIDIDDLEKGIYFIDVEVNGENMAMEKVIIL